MEFTIFENYLPFRAIAINEDDINGIAFGQTSHLDIINEKQKAGKSIFRTSALALKKSEIVCIKEERLYYDVKIMEDSDVCIIYETEKPDATFIDITVIYDLSGNRYIIKDNLYTILKQLQ